MSEVLLGLGLRGVPRESYLLGSKLGRYSDVHFDFSARRVEESVHVSLQRLKTDHLDVLLLHDPEFVKLPQIWEETLPAVENIRKWASWLEQPIDRALLAEVLSIFEPVKDIGHVEGLQENN
jgi:aryl-alcohol dehydrogenase-like predicted oxidoreductase